MFRLVKWAYELGVNLERRRIANFLNEETYRRRLGVENIHNFMDNHAKDLSADVRKENLFWSEVHNEIEVIISKLFQSDFTTVPGPSVMFPDDENNKKEER